MVIHNLHVLEHRSTKVLGDKEKHLRLRIWVSVTCMVCLCGCSSVGEKLKIEVMRQPVVAESHTKVLLDKQILSFSLTQPVSEGCSVAYEGNCVINADGTPDRKNEVTIFTSIMKENTVLANDTKHTGIANVGSNLTIQGENTLLLITTIHYDDSDGDVISHYLEHMTLAVKQNEGTYYIEIVEVTMAQRDKELVRECLQQGIPFLSYSERKSCRIWSYPNSISTSLPRCKDICIRFHHI